MSQTVPKTSPGFLPGVVVHQVTDDPQEKDNIYCERSYCTVDSRHFVFQRHIGPSDQRWKTIARFDVCEFGTWRMRPVAEGLSYCELHAGTSMYFTDDRDGSWQLNRLHLPDGRREVIPTDGGVRPLTGITISPDEHELAYGVELGFGPQMFGVEVVDLGTGRKRIVHRDPEICNPHPQYDPSGSGDILIQHNRGCVYSANGQEITACSGDGPTLFTVHTTSQRLNRLPVGTPHTPWISGHQQWIAATRQILATLGGDRPWQQGNRQGNLISVGPNSPVRLVADGRFNHVHASCCGRYFCCDAGYGGAETIHVGSVRAGRHEAICSFGPTPAGAYERFGQSSHAHPYLSPDNRWVVFNSCRSGVPQICVASVPQDLLNRLA